MSSFKTVRYRRLRHVGAVGCALNTVASNLANAESEYGTPEGAYKAKQPYSRGWPACRPPMPVAAWILPRPSKCSASSRTPRAPEMRYQPGNPLANAEDYVFAPNVNVVEEMGSK